MTFPEFWPRPERRVFEGHFVVLKPLEKERDAAPLFTVSHGTPEVEKLWDYLPYGPFGNESAYFEWMRTVASGYEPLFFTVHQKEQACGVISILNIEPLHGRAELGHIWYAPFVQRTKVNTESVYLLLRHLFDDLNYRRVEWKCNNRNEASKNAASRLGFQAEGLFRQHLVVKGQNRDTAWFSMLDSEWPSRKSNFEQWLYQDDLVPLSHLNK